MRKDYTPSVISNYAAFTEGVYNYIPVEPVYDLIITVAQAATLISPASIRAFLFFSTPKISTGMQIKQ